MSSTSRKKRRTSRSQSSKQLAELLVEKKFTVFITGAGLSVASGVRPFRGQSGLWTEVIWKTATRSSFRKDPLTWYNEFWLPHFIPGKIYEPNDGHFALEYLQELFPDTCHIITQNVDGLQGGNNVLEAHGRVGLYKCIPEEDSDTDSDSDEDEDRKVHLGHRRKSRVARSRIAKQEDSTENGTPTNTKGTRTCKYQLAESISVDKIEPLGVRRALEAGATTLTKAPECPSCHRPAPPQALLFDEGYHSHDFYSFEEMETLLEKAEVICFVGTSFNVSITNVALDHARDNSIPVYNFNTQDVLDPSPRLNVENVLGMSNETLPKLVDETAELLNAMSILTEQEAQSAY